MNVREQVLTKVTAFPTLPFMAQRLLSLVNESDADFAELNKVIQYDPALTANVLKAANSAFLGYGEPVDSITEASFRIGTKWIFQIAVSSLIYANLKVPACGYDLSGEDLWRHSIAVSILSESICKALKIASVGAIFTGALVHDIGKIAIGEAVADQYDEINEIVENDKCSFEKAEEMILGVDHAEVGAMVAQKWNFPEPIVDIIRWHHNPNAAEKATAGIDVVHIADALCLMQGFGIGRDGLQYRYADESISRLKLSTKIIDDAICQLLISFENIEQMFTETNKPAPSAVGR